ncbi:MULTISPECIES: sigma 54-interacting transcriptional regulator [unclassified Leptolyngbya]|uniref:sigma 54-interacting transcriptional regulator n=1 Tax=unclassified Leptolyngbya TaxID=2650499 RepID=UPI00168A1361|nr:MULTISPECIES: sigma 54-interacting transcriptional regulator [unclassified Leptolyngbya]MBD1910768.1 sigma 54-interacting transcriptional regulator [Leptolyngbya sp. FACHB-8]MBD2158844.1 sigma 54-interacting transcriptional regulator [Leptolyngbya sp. FACHB-16]
MDSQEQQNWLQAQTVLGMLPPEVLAAIALLLEPIILPANHKLVTEQTHPDGLYILKQGHVEVHREGNAPLDVGLLPGSVLYLKEVLLEQPTEQTIVTLDESELWRVQGDRLRALALQYPVINQVLSRQLADELNQMSAQLTFEQERQIALRPYLLPKVKRGIIGSSRYAVRLRNDITKASKDRRPVLIFGEPGLGKDNAAALVHFGGDDRKQPLIRVDCDKIQANGAELFGRAGGKAGLLDWLGRGTLLLNNIQELPKELRPKIRHLVKTGEYTPITRDGEEASPRQSQARFIFTSERTLPELERQQSIGHIIKVPPLRVRKADLEPQVNYYIGLYCKAKGLNKPTVAPEALRRLQGYDFPGNLSELESMVERAVIQSNCAPVLTEEVFWAVGSKTRRFRINLLNSYPRLRQFLRSPWWPDRINYGITFTLFAVVVAILWFGPQSRDRNIALNLFWAWWWPLVLLIFPFLGRIWCSVCPFMIYGEIAQKITNRFFPGSLRSWPRTQAERWGGWFVFGMFALILLWEELWNLENTAYLSGCLLMLITAGAVVFSVLFERRFWCRYLCPIGGMNGLFAKLSMTELRAQQGICSATCTTYQCYRGGPEKGEGQETGGCPLYSHPAQLQDNRDCVLCMTCLKACPHRSVEFNLRPPGIELWTTHKPTLHEVYLLFLLFGAVFLHHLPESLIRLGISQPTQILGNVWGHLGISGVALLVPGAIALLAYGAMHLFNHNPHPRPFVELAYGYLPLVLAANLAHYLHLGLTEVGRVIPVSLATVGLSGGEALVLTVHPAVIAFLQGSTLMAGVLLSIVVAQKIARQPFRCLLPQHIASGAIALLLWPLILG